MAAVLSHYAHPVPSPSPYPSSISSSGSSAAAGTKARGYRLCDHCGAVEQPGVARFRMCGGCLITQYCSPECQKRHWPGHKAICQHTSNLIQSSKGNQSQSRSISPNANSDDLARALRKFCSVHQTLLGWAGFQALQLKKLPANVRQSALLVEVGFEGGSGRGDIVNRFSLLSTHIVPRTYITSRDPLVAEDIQRREDRCRRSGGLGTILVLIQCGDISQVMPVECDAPQKIGWDVRGDWEEVLRSYVDSGRGEFRPITTTANGVYYG